MSDLSHWDIATDFTGKEAAALAMGIDPAMPDYVFSQNNPLYGRMKRHYDVAKRAIGQCDDPQFIGDAEPIRSVDLEWITTNEDPEDGAYLPRWLRDPKLSGFDVQRFDRHEIGRWLLAVGFQSRYSFGPSKADKKLAVEKPLGLTERRTLLTIIAALAQEAKININSPGKAALSIESLTDSMGCHVSKRAIEEHLKKIPDALATRMK